MFSSDSHIWGYTHIKKMKNKIMFKSIINTNKDLIMLYICLVQKIDRSPSVPCGES